MIGNRGIPSANIVNNYEILDDNLLSFFVHMLPDISADVFGFVIIPKFMLLIPMLIEMTQ